MKRREFIAGISATAMWPLAAQAQQRTIPVVGYLRGGTENRVPRLTAAFGQGLSEQGYVEGSNVEILDVWSGARNDRLPALAADLARRQVAAIFATGGTEWAAKAATTRRMNFAPASSLEHFSIRLGVARVCEISFAFVFGNPFEKRGDCFPKLLNSARLHFA